MKWYAAHIIQYIKFRDGIQDSFRFYENVVLIEADSSDEAWQKAEAHGKSEEYDDPSFTCNNRPAQLVFAGVRKIISPAGSEDLENSPRHGTELTYSLICIDNKEDFEKYVANESVMVYYEE